VNLTFAFQNTPAQLVTPCSTNNLHRQVQQLARQTGGTVLINSTQQNLYLNLTEVVKILSALFF
jgi:hypothetical protein